MFIAVILISILTATTTKSPAKTQDEGKKELRKITRAKLFFPSCFTDEILIFKGLVRRQNSFDQT